MALKAPPQLDGVDIKAEKEKTEKIKKSRSLSPAQNNNRVKAPMKAKSKSSVTGAILTDPDIPEIEFLTPAEIMALKKLLLTRSSTSQLYSLVDKQQFMNAIALQHATQKMYDDYRSGGIITNDLDSLQKLMTMFKSNVSTINQTFKALGLDASTRKEEVSGDDLTKMLLTASIENNEVPQLQTQYLRMQEDIKHTMEGPSREQQEQNADKLRKIRQPIRSYKGERFDGSNIPIEKETGEIRTNMDDSKRRTL